MMIYIRLDPNKIPPEWLEKAKKLVAELDAIDDPTERVKFIKDHDIWGEIKHRLLQLSYGKCWYSEAPDAVSDWHVDHFRPKASYQWLAFDWRNFRVCGAIPNRAKRDEFPLAANSPRASWESRDCTCECCLLLDPTNPTDPGLITFDESGLPQPINPDWPTVRERVQLTTELLSLDAARLVEARKKKWRDCRKWIDQLLTILPMQSEQVDPHRYAQIQIFSQYIQEMTRPSEPFSAVARACVKAANMDFLIAKPEHDVAG
jgi:uncharacterized protein (TIGR02646 family)